MHDEPRCSRLLARLTGLSISNGEYKEIDYTKLIFGTIRRLLQYIKRFIQA